LNQFLARRASVTVTPGVEYDEIIDAAWQAWRNLEADPERISSIGIRKWAQIGHSP
jgi:hypothetical protein